MQFDVIVNMIVNVAHWCRLLPMHFESVEEKSNKNEKSDVCLCYLLMYIRYTSY